MIKDKFWRADFKRITPIAKGYSDSDKYLVELSNGEKMLLRTRSASHYETQKMIFEKLIEMDKLSIICPKPIEFGILEGDREVYMLLSWIEGEDGRSALGKLSNTKQYELGYKAGQMLRKIHSLTLTSELNNEHTFRYKQTIQKRIESYQNCGVHFDNAEKVINYLRNNLSLLDTASLCIRHGDYHIGNIIVTGDNEVGIIDFDSLGYGYTWEDFDGILWCLEVSKYFATGRIDGYFNNDIPENFFPLLALFLSRAVISSIPWAQKFNDEEVSIALDNAKILLDSYDDMTNVIPKWYLGANWKSD